MTPEQMKMFQLQAAPDPVVNVPGQVAQAGDPMVQSMEVNVVSEGLANSIAYMARNGPTRPIHRGRAKIMTKQQLEEQKMNEAAGLPANLDAAARVVSLENMVRNLNDNVGKMAQILTQVVEAREPTTLQPAPPPTPLAVEAKEYAALHTPPERPAAEPLPQLGQNPTSAERNLRQSPPPAQRTVTPIPPSAAPESPPGTYHQASPPQVSPETLTQNEVDEILTNGARGSGRAAGEVECEAFYGKAPQVSLGTVGSGGQGDGFDRFELTEPEEVVSPGEDQILDQEEPVVHPALDPVEQKRLEHQQILTDQVTTWLGQKDPHKFFRQFLSGACNKNLSYNTWPQDFQGKFNERFKAMVTDPCFVSTLCGRITRMQNGHLVAPHVAGAFITVMAGFLSFALLEA